MAELEIEDDDFTPLTAASDVPTELSLEGCNLIANAPPRELPGLQTLNLAECTVDAAALERWFAACPDLAEVDIEGCQIGDLPWSTFPMKLRALYIRGGELNSLTGARATGGLQKIELTACKLHRVELPKSLGSLKGLSFAFNPDLGECPELPWSAAPFALDVRGCGLRALPTGEGVDKIGSLNASDNPISTVDASLAAMLSLSTLRLQQCELQKIDPAIGELPHLENLWLTDNPLRELPDALFAAKNLKVLDLVRCRLPAWPEQLHKATRLEALLLSENRIEAVPDDVTRLTNLRNLRLWKTGLRRLPATLQGLEQLKQLDVSYNPLTQLPDLAGLPALGFLGLCGLRDLDWPAAFDRLAELQHIGQISFTNSNFASFDRRVFDVPGLSRIDINKTPVEAAFWAECRDRHPRVTIWGN